MEKVDTLIELFCAETLKNVVPALALQPARLVMLVHTGAQYTDVYENTVRALRDRMPRLVISYFEADCNDPDSVREALEALYAKYPEGVFDLTGGSELLLLSAFAFARRKDAAMLHIDLPRQRLMNLNGCDALEGTFVMPELTLRDHLNMNGAFFDGVGHVLMEQEQEPAVRAFCQQVIRNQPRWRKQCNYFQAACSGLEGLDVDQPVTFIAANRSRVTCDVDYLYQLQDMGFLHSVQRDKGRVRFSFAADNYKSYLTDVGVWLELYTYLLLRDTGLFKEIYMSVRVGWGDESDEYKGTAYNELDVVACNGLETIFISCKTGTPEPGDFNEIQVYAKKFGGRFGRAVLCTSQELGRGFVGMHTRARDLGAAIVDKSDLRDGRAVRLLQDLMQVK